MQTNNLPLFILYRKPLLLQACRGGQQTACWMRGHEQTPNLWLLRLRRSIRPQQGWFNKQQPLSKLEHVCLKPWQRQSEYSIKLMDRLKHTYYRMSFERKFHWYDRKTLNHPAQQLRNKQQTLLIEPSLTDMTGHLQISNLKVHLKEHEVGVTQPV